MIVFSVSVVARMTLKGAIHVTDKNLRFHEWSVFGDHYAICPWLGSGAKTIGAMLPAGTAFGVRALLPIKYRQNLQRCRQRMASCSFTFSYGAEVGPTDAA